MASINKMCFNATLKTLISLVVINVNKQKFLSVRTQGQSLLETRTVTFGHAARRLKWRATKSLACSRLRFSGKHDLKARQV